MQIKKAGSCSSEEELKKAIDNAFAQHKKAKEEEKAKTETPASPSTREEVEALIDRTTKLVDDLTQKVAKQATVQEHIDIGVKFDEEGDAVVVFGKQPLPEGMMDFVWRFDRELSAIENIVKIISDDRLTKNQIANLYTAIMSKLRFDLDFVANENIED